MISAASPENLLSWAAQVFVLASLGALLPLVLRLQHPRSHLIYCHAVLITCLVLPLIQPWQHELITIGNESPPRTPATATTLPGITTSPASAAISWQSVIIWVFAIGIAAKLCWLAAGLWQISRYRATAILLYPRPQSIADACSITKSAARFCVSTATPGPVTFGFLSPVVLLPQSFLTLGQDEQRAIACHELLHVRRKDWLVTLAEELLSVLFWFQPAIWWLLAQTRLAREQLVDAQVVRLTQAREPYIDALLAMAGSKPQLDLAPAPLFLRRRHLIQRMHSLLSEVSMSGFRLVSSYALMAVILAGAAWLALINFPLMGEAQVQVTARTGPADPAGITVDAGGSLVRRGPIVYPPDAYQKRIEGAVFAELSVNKNGDVTDARILSGPDELRRTVLQSVLQWRYAPDSAPSGRVVASIDFRAVPGAAPPVLMGPSSGFTYTASSAGSMPVGLRGTVMFPALFQGALAPIDVSAVPEPLRNQLTARLTQFHGQRVTPDLLAQIDQVAKETIPSGTQRTMRYGLAENKTDTTLRITTQPNEAAAVAAAPRNAQTPVGQRGTSAGIATPFGVQSPGQAGVATPFGTAVTNPAAGGAPSPQRVRIGANVAAAQLITQAKPEYPPLARDAKVQGAVVLETVIGSDGRVSNLQVIAGHPLLVQAAIDAVKQWIYQPVLLNDQAVEAITTVTVTFNLQE